MKHGHFHKIPDDLSQSHGFEKYYLSYLSKVNEGIATCIKANRHPTLGLSK
jgi:hypothetical protein